MNKENQKTEKAYLAAGCFWGVEEAFRTLPGVIETSVGYAGEYAKNSSDDSMHAETVEIEFNPEKITFEKILKKFWEIHDPTTPNRQGPNLGSKYRSAIFYTSEKQQKEALKSKREQEESEKFPGPIATEITPIKPGEYHRAEEFHQKYLAKRGASVCS